MPGLKPSVSGASSRARRSVPSPYPPGSLCNRLRTNGKAAFAGDLSWFCAERVCWMQCLIAGDSLFGFSFGCRGGGFDFAERDETRDFLLLEHFLAVELGHAGVFGVLLDLRIACADLFFAGVLRDAGLVEGVVGGGVDVGFVEDEVVGGFLFEADLLTAGEDLVTSVLLVPLGEGGGHVHLLDDVAPADARVVRAEADLAFLCRVRDDALLSAA